MPGETLGDMLGNTVATTSPPAPDLVSPGIAGFIVVFLLALATVLLLRSMVGHLRKVRYGPGPATEGEPQPQPRPPASESDGDGRPARGDADDAT